MCIYIPTELPFCLPPVVVGNFFSFELVVVLGNSMRFLGTFPPLFPASECFLLLHSLLCLLKTFLPDVDPDHAVLDSGVDMETPKDKKKKEEENKEEEDEA